MITADKGLGDSELIEKLRKSYDFMHVLNIFEHSVTHACKRVNINIVTDHI